MNNSGEAVRECAAFYKIPAEKVIVIYDDISLDVGKLRIRRKGTDGGHNGIKSIIYHLNSDQFPRIKVGCGKKPHPEYDLADWVLSEFKKDELKALEPALENACKALELLLDNNTEKAMNLYNS
jgi:PTH1 family peptidyl-tRNA hydrolase